MKIKKIIPVILVGMIVVMIFVNFMGRNEKMNEKPLSIGTEYGVQVNDKQLYTLTIDHISKVQTYLNHEIVIIDLTYQNNHIEENFIIDHKNFDVIDDDLYHVLRKLFKPTLFFTILRRHAPLPPLPAQASPADALALGRSPRRILRPA